MKLREYLESDTFRLVAGMRISLIDDQGDKRTIWIGHATPYHSPTDSDLGLGWDWDEDYCGFEVTRIDDFSQADFVTIGS